MGQKFILARRTIEDFEILWEITSEDILDFGDVLILREQFIIMDFKENTTENRI